MCVQLAAHYTIRKQEIILESVHQKAHPDLQKVKFDAGNIPILEDIEIELYNTLADSKGAIREMCSHILSAGGKRIRPLLVYYSGRIFEGAPEELVKAAVAAELIHMASLVHDDIIDNSDLRRSRPSVNKIWGNHFAVLCGDYLFAKAFGILAGSRLTKSMDYMVHAIQNMCHGEILQASDRFNGEVSLTSYYERIAMKTGIFIECCCKSGAVIAGAGDMQLQMVGEYGLNLGLAFQIIDDILDFCGEVEVMGKPRCEDLMQGSITLPVLLLMGDKNYEGPVKEMIQGRLVTEQAADHITALLHETGTIRQAFEIASSHIEKAKHCLGFLPQTENAAFLYDLADMLKGRMN